MMWFDPADHRALFVDKRAASEALPGGRCAVIDPDQLADFTSLPFDDGQFDLVVFDPPHTFSGPNSVMAKKYGRLLPGWREEIAAGLAECFRVLRVGGTLILKWNEHRVPLATILSLTPEAPLFGQKTNRKTHWVVWMKAPVDARPELKLVQSTTLDETP